MPELGHAFRDPALLTLALTHASCDGGADNERLEFLGDAVLDLVVAEALHAREPRLDEGRMTQLKADVVSRRSLAEPARRLGLERLARLGPGLRGRSPSQAVLANLYEALIGAVHLDAGYAAAREFVHATLAEELGRALGDDARDNPKQRLQELCQARYARLPTYEVVETRGAAHERAFLVAAGIDGRRFPAAWGRTLKEAESWAAFEALLEIEPVEPAGP
ncbi:MAG: ribonuclease III [Planctomycetes bacterium]|jgi:ribonuclease-3|nr:ribonuclease III [Planctomycetota bacterium]